MIQKKSTAGNVTNKNRAGAKPKNIRRDEYKPGWSSWNRSMIAKKKTNKQKKTQGHTQQQQEQNRLIDKERGLIHVGLWTYEKKRVGKRQRQEVESHNKTCDDNSYKIKQETSQLTNHNTITECRCSELLGWTCVKPPCALITVSFIGLYCFFQRSCSLVDIQW